MLRDSALSLMMRYDKECTNKSWCSGGESFKELMKSVFKTESEDRNFKILLRELKFNPNGNLDKFIHKFQEKAKQN